MKKKILILILVACSVFVWAGASKTDAPLPGAEISLQDEPLNKELVNLLKQVEKQCNERGAASLKRYFRQSPQQLRICGLAGVPNPVTESLAVLEADGKMISFEAFEVYVPNVPDNNIYLLEATIQPMNNRIRFTFLKENGYYSLTRIASSSKVN